MKHHKPTWHLAICCTYLQFVSTAYSRLFDFDAYFSCLQASPRPASSPRPESSARSDQPDTSAAMARRIAELEEERKGKADRVDELSSMCDFLGQAR